MAGNIIGLDPAAVTAMAGKFTAEAQAIQGVISKLESIVNANVNQTWKGTDATQFQNQWQGTLKKQLANIAEQLNQAATTAKKNVADQQSTSSRLA